MGYNNQISNSKIYENTVFHKLYASQIETRVSYFDNKFE